MQGQLFGAPCGLFQGFDPEHGPAVPGGCERVFAVKPPVRELLQNVGLLAGENPAVPAADGQRVRPGSGLREKRHAAAENETETALGQFLNRGVPAAENGGQIAGEERADLDRKSVV